MRKAKFLLFGLLLFVVLNFFLIPLAHAQGYELSKQEWVIVTILGLIATPISVAFINLLKKIPWIAKTDGISSITSIFITFCLAYVIDLITKSNLPLINLWFLTLNIQTLSQIGYSTGVIKLFEKKMPA